MEYTKKKEDEIRTRDSEEQKTAEFEPRDSGSA
jgi:hypothetical protein